MICSKSAILILAANDNYRVLKLKISQDTFEEYSYIDGIVYKLTFDNKEKILNELMANNEAIKLYVISDEINIKKNERGFPDPLSIEGIKEDIPYNFKADLFHSSIYLEALIRSGWMIETYNSDSLTILITLINENKDLIRVKILEDSLKVYSKDLYP